MRSSTPSPGCEREYHENRRRRLRNEEGADREATMNNEPGTALVRPWVVCTQPLWSAGSGQTGASGFLKDAWAQSRVRPAIVFRGVVTGWAVLLGTFWL